MGVWRHASYRGVDTIAATPVKYNAKYSNSATKAVLNVQLKADVLHFPPQTKMEGLSDKVFAHIERDTLQGGRIFRSTVLDCIFFSR